MLNNKMNILKACIKSIVFNKEDIVIETFYPIEFKKNFSNILNNDEEKMAILENKYVLDVFTVSFDFFETFMNAFEQAILESRDEIRKELLLVAQLKSLKGVGLHDVLAQKNIQLNEDIVQEILTMEHFDYENELYEAWDKIMSNIEEKEVTPQIVRPQIQDEIIHNIPPVPTTYPLTFDDSADDGIMVTSMDEIEKEYEKFNAGEGIYYEDDELNDERYQ